MNEPDSLPSLPQGTTSDLFQVFYSRLRQVAGAQVHHELPGQTFSATDLVHEAFLRLNRRDGDDWNDTRHFLATAAEAMRCILIDRARSKARLKRGGQHRRVTLDDITWAEESAPDDLLDVNEVLESLAKEHPQAAALVKLRYFGGFSTEEAADILSFSRATAYRHWQFAKAWMFNALRRND